MNSVEGDDEYPEQMPAEVPDESVDVAEPSGEVDDPSGEVDDPFVSGDGDVPAEVPDESGEVDDPFVSGDGDVPAEVPDESVDVAEPSGEVDDPFVSGDGDVPAEVPEDPIELEEDPNARALAKAVEGAIEAIGVEDGLDPEDNLMFQNSLDSKPETLNLIFGDLEPPNIVDPRDALPTLQFRGENVANAQQGNELMLAAGGIESLMMWVATGAILFKNKKKWFSNTENGSWN